MLPTLPNLDGLIGLARQDGVDVRPTLLRVLTDLYVHKPIHTRDEEHRFTELTLSLLTGVDVPTRAAIAKKLAAYAGAPHAVVRRLARDVLEVAEPILKASPCLTGDELLAIIRDFGPSYAAAIGARDKPQTSDDRAGDPGTCSEERPSLHDPIGSDQAQDTVAKASDLTPARAEPVAVGEYFFNAG